LPEISDIIESNNNFKPHFAQASRGEEKPMVKGSNLSVDKEKCISCGTCIASYGTLFKFGKDGKSKPIENASCKECKINEVIDICPQGAISKK